MPERVRSIPFVPEVTGCLDHVTGYLDRAHIQVNTLSVSNSCTRWPFRVVQRIVATQADRRTLYADLNVYEALALHAPLPRRFLHIMNVKRLHRTTPLPRLLRHTIILRVYIATQHKNLKKHVGKCARGEGDRASRTSHMCS